MAGLAACGTQSSPESGQLSISTHAVTSSEVVGVLYEIVCEDGTVLSEYVALEDEGLPAHVDASYAGQPFADFFTLLSPGDCTVTATAMTGPDEPANGCDPVSEDVTIVADQTTEVLLVIQCESDPVGALDVITVITDAPSIVDLVYDDSKFILQCEEVNITVTGAGGQAPLTYDFTVISTPAGADFTVSSTGNVLTFSAETPGMYEVTVTVTDATGATAELTFPIHVSDDPNIEHCGEVCCLLEDGHLFFGDVDACEEAGGVTVAEEKCEAEVCCKTPTGPQFIEAASCPQGAVLADEQCKETFCCETPDGLQYTASPDECESLGGVIVADAACDKEVCCKTGNGNELVPSADCPPGQEQPADLCAPEDVCCRLEDGTVYIIPDDECAAAGGSIEPMEKCLPEVCCEFADGSLQTVPVGTCNQLGGAEASADLCKEICCIFEQGLPSSIMTAGDCQNAGGVASPLADCEGTNTQTWTANYTLDPDAPCDPEPYLVVPSSGANKLAVYDLTTLLPLPTTPFDTCSNPSRVMMDSNTDVYASCREGSLGGRVRKNSRDGLFLWETQLTACTGARGIAMSGDGRLFAVCSSGSRAIFELNPATGAIIQSLPLANNWYPYGVTPSSDALYVAYLSSGVTRIDLATFTEVWTVAVNPGPYGISADGLGGVWIGGSSLQRLDAAGVVTDIIDTTDSGTYTQGYVTGVQVALDGTVNATLYFHDTVVRHDPFGGTTDWWPADVAANQTYGVTADANNNLYTINRTSSSLTKFDTAGNTTGFGEDALSNPVLVSPYGYSGDMTGITACLAGTTDEWVSAPFDSGSGTTTWGVISWVATTPPGSSVSVYYSTDGTTWTQVTNGQSLGIVAQTIWVKAILQSTIAGNEPTISSISIDYTL